MKKVAGLLVFLLSVSTSVAGPTTIAEWDLENAVNGVVTPLDLTNDVTASQITYSGVRVLTGSVSEGVLVAQNWATGSAADLALYYEFSFTAGDDTAVTLDSMRLSLVRGNYRGGHGAETWQIAASQDGFASQFDLSSLDISGSTYDQIVVFDDVDISSLGTVMGTVTFRLYGYDYSRNTQDFSGLAYSSDLLSGQGVNLAITGSTHSASSPVPVPGAIVMASLGVCLLSRFRRLRSGY